MPPGTGWPGDPSAPGTPVARGPDDVRRLGRSAPDLAELEALVGVCRACPRLVAWREQVAAQKRRAFAGEPYWGRPVPGWGDEHAWLLVVGLAPAAHGGNRTGRIFTGDRSGDWIFAALHRAGLATRPHSVDAADGQQLIGARMAAPVRCAPPANKPTPAERDTCAPWFDREVTLLEPTLRVVLALGAFAWEVVLAAAVRLGWSLAGSPGERRPRFAHAASVALGRPGAAPVTLLATYHVSQQNTFTGKLTEQMLDDVLAEAVASAGVPAPPSTPRTWSRD